ncbi:MAG: tripartite tricarboxylate transporter TctB family protein [Deltaproteobacteria bacterium]|nr:tripartite tricarboxylate transporter TctB family protein [Deltaproteobacteria bacterium]
MTLNRISGLVFAVMGAVLMFWIIPSQTEAALDFGWLNPTTLPRITSVIIILAGLIHFVLPAGNAELDVKLSLRMGLFFLVACVGLYVMKLIGFVYTAPPLILAIMIMVKEHRVLWLSLGVIGLPFSMWFCIEFLLDTPLP